MNAVPQPPSSPDEAPLAIAPVADPLQSLTVLLVEDDPVIRASLALPLAKRVGAVIEAGNGEEGLARFREHRPHVVITDLVMPGLDGLALTRAIKAESPATPVVIATGHSEADALIAAIEIGVDRYVLKPVQVDCLLGVLGPLAYTAALESRQKLAAQVFAASSEAILIADADLTVVDANDAFTRITGYERSEVLGLHVLDLDGAIEGEAFLEALWRTVRDTGHWRGELWSRRKSGELYPEWRSVDVVRDADGRIRNYVVAWTDISERKEAEARIQYLAHYDALTDLPNRVLFSDRFEQALIHARRAGETVGVLFTDLDRFKLVNDSLGHKVGDQVLQEASRRLLSCVRAEDTVSRLGGDEFVILLPALRTPQDAGRVAEKVVAALARPFRHKGDDLSISASVGIACFPNDGELADTLLTHADLAMYRAKSVGRNNFQFFSPELESGALSRLSLEHDMRQGLERGEFELLYQPQVDNPTGRLLGVEALIRWHHPERGLLLPRDFIPLAEESGFIVPLSLWVLAEAARQVSVWRGAGLPPVRVSINLCAAQLKQPDFAANFARILAEAGVAGESFELEFTEQVLMQDGERNLLVLSDLKKLGVGITLDDFGVGYSNLNVLRRLPVDTLKIDRSLVSEVTENKDDAVIVDAIISMAQRMDLKVVAEGVETADQAGFFRDRACQEIQGHFFSKPLAAADLPGYLNSLPDVLAQAAV